MLMADLERHQRAVRPVEPSPDFKDLLTQVSREYLEPAPKLRVA